MDDIRMFIKKNAVVKLQHAIKYNDDHVEYKYKYGDTILTFKEYADDLITLNYNKTTYDTFNDIQLILFDLFNYKNIEYIDAYLQKKVSNNSSYNITDLYNDYYDDYEKKLICTRRLTITTADNDIKEFKLKFIINNEKDHVLYYDCETINGIDDIIKKIDQIL
jgi:hypothetical protein